MGSQGRGCMIRCRVSQMISHRGDFRASVLVASVLGFERMRSCEKCVLTAAERYEEQRAAGDVMGAPLCEGRGKAMQELENGACLFDERVPLPIAAAREGAASSHRPPQVRL